MALTLTSPAFADGGSIPARYTCDGENVNPELHISGVPEGTKSLVLVMDDPDIPDSVKESRGIEKFDHWVLYNIPPDTTVIKEGEMVGSEGLSSRGEVGYVGSCPPDREHRYFFRLYALPDIVNFIKVPTLDEVEVIAKESAIESAVLMGKYERIK
ncbi:MAG: YbhB/YbcL family Raf kinase inhibitor-like protein [Candidatus Nomurabacteria bacterium]|nr:YbhB/YbcL family Raf kinase inhibitor-like protein [Candidatus Nomurabacteria bacterium]USN88293.1 MAG: YbhB/YbcL family Raf kinase inhibitor-like protein [Candidatus Nomurabacteria bacterium]